MKGFKVGICPICKSGDLDYKPVELELGFLYYPVECNNCFARGKEFYNIEFTDIVMEELK